MRFSQRPRSPSRPRYGRPSPDDFEVVRYRDVEPDFPEEEYRDVRIKRERTIRRRRSRPRSKSSSSSSSEGPVRRTAPGKKGKTKFPKRMVERRAIVEFGCEVEEAPDHWIAKRALSQEQIDEVIKLSEKYRESKYDESALSWSTRSDRFADKTIYKYDNSHSHFEAPAASQAPSRHTSGGHARSVHESSYEVAHDAPPPTTYHRAPMHVSRRSPSPRGHTYEVVEDPHHSVGGPLTVVLPRRQSRSDRDIKAEIRALEAEKRALKLEREAEEKRERAERIRDGEYELVERGGKDRGSELRVERMPRVGWLWSDPQTIKEEADFLQESDVIREEERSRGRTWGRCLLP